MLGSRAQAVEEPRMPTKDEVDHIKRAPLEECRQRLREIEAEREAFVSVFFFSSPALLLFKMFKLLFLLLLLLLFRFIWRACFLCHSISQQQRANVMCGVWPLNIFVFVCVLCLWWGSWTRSGRPQRRCGPSTRQPSPNSSWRRRNRRTAAHGQTFCCFFACACVCAEGGRQTMSWQVFCSASSRV